MIIFLILVQFIRSLINCISLQLTRRSKHILYHLPHNCTVQTVNLFDLKTTELQSFFSLTPQIPRIIYTLVHTISFAIFIPQPLLLIYVKFFIKPSFQGPFEITLSRNTVINSFAHIIIQKFIHSFIPINNSFTHTNLH